MLRLLNPALATPDLILKVHPSLPIQKLLHFSIDDKAFMIRGDLEILHLPKSVKNRKDVYDLAQLFGEKGSEGRIALVETGEFYDLLLSVHDVQGHDIILLEDDEIETFFDCPVIMELIRAKRS